MSRRDAPGARWRNGPAGTRVKLHAAQKLPREPAPPPLLLREVEKHKRERQEGQGAGGREGGRIPPVPGS